MSIEKDTTTIMGMAKLSPQERKQLYQVNNLNNKHIDIVKVDNESFTDYAAFTFLEEKTFVKSPTRTGNGSIPDMDTYAWFLTPHLKIDFSIMSIDSYRRMMNLIQSKNEFVVTCYDVVKNCDVTHKMYFATEQMPKLWNIARKIKNNLGQIESWVELLGVQDYTIELIGTNNDVQTNTITYNLNVPYDVIWSGETTSTQIAPYNVTSNISTMLSDGTQKVNVSTLTFNDLYRFLGWCENSNGVGFIYLDNHEYLIRENKTLYAIWTRSA